MAGDKRCLVCEKHAGKGDPPPGGYILQGKYFAVCHGPPESSPLGTFLVESKRHFLDDGEMRDSEAGELGRILSRLYPAIKKATGAVRIYSLSMMEGAPHFHLWLVPRTKKAKVRGVKFLAQNHSSRAEDAKRLAARVRRSLN